MHILYHHRTQGRGAEGVHIASMIQAFKDLGHLVTILSPPGVDPLTVIGQKPLDKSDSKTSGIDKMWKYISRYSPQIFFELLEIFYNFVAILRMKKIMTAVKIDFIYERNAYFLFAGAYISKRYNIPLVVEANEVVGIKRARRLILKNIALKLESYTFNVANSIFTVSSFLKRKIAETVIDQEKVNVTPNAVDPKNYQRPTKREEIRRELELSDKIVMGFAGWFDWWDRLDILIDAQKELTDIGYGNVSTMLIGDGPGINELKEQALQLGIKAQIIFTGAVERKKVLDYIDAIDIGVFAHSNDFGSPVVLFEMMSLGKPIVAPALEPIQDVIKNKENGVIFKSLDRHDFRVALQSLLDDELLRETIGTNAKKCCMEKYTWDTNAKNVLKSL
jgi:glycosyltransferase involved in cell wall biosynthesis